MQPKCSAHSTRTGLPCRRYAIRGSNVCPAHGGTSPQVKRKAAERVAEARARAELERWSPADPEPLADPYDALLRLAAQADQWRQFLAARVAELQDEIRYGHRAGEQVRAEITLFGQAMDRCGRILESIAKLDIAEKQVRIREAEIILMAEGIREILRRLDLTPEQRHASVAIVPEVLRALEARPAPEIGSAGREVYVSARRSPVIR